MPRRKPKPIEEQGDGLAWEQFHATAQGIDAAVLLEREHLAQQLVEGRLDPSWLSGAFAYLPQ